MELKSALASSFARSKFCSNRTFMELKFDSRSHLTTSHQQVLIAPLWNWNNCRGRVERVGRGSNRTFMELKFKYFLCKIFGGSVLIAPLWNWNYSIHLVSRDMSFVLIAPLWNWNYSYGLQQVYPSRSNRTFMELKFGIGQLRPICQLF